MRHYFKLLLLTIITLSATISLSAQSCKNQVKNNSANNASAKWETHGSTTIATLAGGNKAFQVLTSSSHFHQDMTIPAGTKSAYFGGWTRNSQAKATTGHAYLYGYIMDANDKILEYVQLGVTNKTMKWQYQDKKVAVAANAKKVRLFLKRSSINGQNDTKNMAYFDNLIIAFNCSRKTPNPDTKPCKNHVKNNAANNGESNWSSHGTTNIANLAGGNKAFQVQQSDSHFYQDMTIPKGSKTAYIGGYTRNSQPNAPTGHAYLYAYIMDKNDKILEYVQFGVTHTGMIWTYQNKLVNLNSEAVKVRLFLKKSAKNGVADTGNMAYFDNLVVSFNCKKKTPQPKQY